MIQVFGNGLRGLPENFTTEDFNYSGRYPNGLDLKPGSETHQRLISRIMSNALASQRVMLPRHATWRELDRNLTAFVPAKTLEVGTQIQKVQKVLIIPALFALLDVMLSNLLLTFSEEPIYRYRWTGEEDMIGAILLERVVSIKNRKSKAILAIHTMLRDALVYGFGIVVPTWRTTTGKYVSKEAVPAGMLQTMLEGMGLAQPKPPSYKKILKTGVTNEGVFLENVDPYLVLADPNTPIERLNVSESIGWLRPDNLSNKLEAEKQYGSGYFNARYLSHLTGNYGRSTIFAEERNDKSQVYKDHAVTDISRPMDDIEYQIRLIPSEWGLGSSNELQRWRFCLTGDCILTAAHPLEYPFDTDFQAIVCAPEYDGHSAVPISRIEISYGVADFINFSFSANKMYHERSLNGALIYDPSMIWEQDMKQPGPGLRIRLKRRAWGGDVNRAMMQLRTESGTPQLISDALTAIGLMEKFSGVSEPSQGVIRDRGERVSAKEAGDASLGGLRRTDRVVKIASTQAMFDLAEKTALMTQWNMSENTYVDLTGRGEQILRNEYGDENSQIYVKPEDLAVRTDVEPYDATSVMTENPQALTQFLQLAASQPELMQKLDITRIYLHAARLYGFTNVQDFLRKGPVQTSVQPTDQVANAAQAGNAVPVGGAPTSWNVGNALGA